MQLTTFFQYLVVMAGVTYAIRALPYLFARKEIHNVFIKSFLAYIPYTVLGAMTFPAILTATQSVYSAIAGLLAALILAYFHQGLVKVALGSCLTVLVTEFVMQFFVK